MIKKFALAIKLDDVYVAIGDIVEILTKDKQIIKGRISDIDTFGFDREMKVDTSGIYNSSEMGVKFRLIDKIKILGDNEIEEVEVDDIKKNIL